MTTKLSEADMEILVSCIKNSSTKLTPDFEKVAQECSLKSKNTAYHRHWSLMKKLGLTTTRTQAGGAKVGATGGTRKRASAVQEEDTGDTEVDASSGEGLETPSKKAKTSG